MKEGFVGKWFSGYLLRALEFVLMYSVADCCITRHCAKDFMDVVSLNCYPHFADEEVGT